ncbi:MAG: HNH endonuclease domain-containing protein [Gammaproteobacteria bacterium]
MNIPQFPTSELLNTQAFGNIFNHTTNAYKFLWMDAILKLLQTTHYGKECFQVKDITKDMLVSAYYPLVHFRLSFGKQDQIKNYYDNLTGCLLHDNIGKVERLIVRQGIPAQISSQLSKYVLFRVLTPFYAEELRGLLDVQKNPQIKKLANAQYDKNFPPFYRISDNDDKIYVHEMWRGYIKDNEKIIRGWLTYYWIKFLQTRNPNIPAIANKIEKPQERGSMASQREFWADIIRQQKIHCLYSKRRISTENFALDHYIPWNFIGHNQLWNLVPTIKEVNSSKSDNLPSAIYYEGFVKIQHISVNHLNETPPQKWRHLRESYEVSLHVPLQKLIMQDQLRKSLEETILPMLKLAQNAGFINWKYPSG